MIEYIIIFLLLSIGSALIGYYYGRSHDQRKIKKYRVKKIKLTDNLTDDDTLTRQNIMQHILI